MLRIKHSIYYYTRLLYNINFHTGANLIIPHSLIGGNRKICVPTLDGNRFVLFLAKIKTTLRPNSNGQYRESSQKIAHLFLIPNSIDHNPYIIAFPSKIYREHLYIKQLFILYKKNQSELFDSVRKATSEKKEKS